MNGLSKWHLDTEVTIVGPKGNEKTFVTDEDTKNLIEKFVKDGNVNTLFVVMSLGVLAGRIIEKDPGLK